MEVTDWVGDTGSGGVRALEFDGVDEFVQLGVSGIPTGQTQISVSGWVKPLALSGAKVWFGLQMSTGQAITIGWLSGTSAAVWMFGGTPLSPTITASTLNTWYHFAYTKNGTANTFTVNGVSTSGTMSNGGGSVSLLNLGRFNAQFPSYINARVDDVRIWDVALTSTDIAWLYNSGSGRGRVVGSSGALVNGQSLIRPADIRPAQSLIG